MSNVGSKFIAESEIFCWMTVTGKILTFNNFYNRNLSSPYVHDVQMKAWF